MPVLTTTTPDPSTIYTLTRRYTSPDDDPNRPYVDYKPRSHSESTFNLFHLAIAIPFIVFVTLGCWVGFHLYQKRREKKKRELAAVMATVVNRGQGSTGVPPITPNVTVPGQVAVAPGQGMVQRVEYYTPPVVMTPVGQESTPAAAPPGSGSSPPTGIVRYA